MSTDLSTLPASEKLRIFVCRRCHTVDEIPFNEVPPEGELDPFIERAVQRHQTCGQERGVGGYVPEQVASGDRFVAIVERKHWSNMATRNDILKRLSTSSTGFEEEVYAVRNTLQEDALKCYAKHGNPKGGCIDYKDQSKAVGNQFLTDEEKLIRRKSGLIAALKDQKKRKTVYLCDYCLSGDTEVVTSTGIFPIRDLVGRADLLIPTTNRWDTPNTRGHFVDVEVRSFGVQRLHEVVLRRGKATKVVRATAEHRWLTAEGELTTASLTEGTRLRSLSATPYRGKAKRIDVAVAQGFVYGDGTVGQNDRRPAKVVIYNEEKDKPLLGFFSWAEPSFNGETWTINGLPRSWKGAPDLEESRSFLLSWLAGYFAADGTVDKRGAASISSARRESLDLVRSVAAICGVRYGVVTQKEREGIDGKTSTLYTLSLDARTLPEWFWVIERHQERVEQRLSSTSQHTPRGWVVESVTDTGMDEEVFCAVVPGVEAFALSDDLMTGNCPVKSKVQEQVFKKKGLYG